MATDSLGQLTVDLVANTGSFEAGMTRAERALKSAAKETAFQGKQLDKLLGQIDPVVGAYGRLDKMEEQLRQHRQKGLLPKEDFDDYLTKLNTQRSALVQTGGAYEKTGMSAKAMAANLRGVPAQFTDIAVSLQGGQAPLTVFLQQGGQLKDMFGGVGPAAKALGGYIVGLINPLTVGAAAAATLGAVFYDAEKEISAFNKSLFSGTASSGQTASSLAEISKTVSAITGDFSEANAAVITLAGSAKLSQTQFINLAQASASISEFSGKSAAEVAKSLGDVGDSATKAAEKISSQYGLLTSAQYEVITALDEQGKKQQALDALSGFLNENAQKRLATYKASLSDVEQEWNNIGAAISNAYSRVKGELFPDLTKQAEIIERVLKTREDGGVSGALSTGLSKLNTALGLADGNNDDSTEALKKKLALIRERLALSQQAAVVDGEAGKADQTRIAASSKWDSEHKSNLAGLAKLEEDINDKRKLGLAAGKSQAEIDKEIAGLRDKYDKSLPKQKAYTEDAGIKQLDQAKQQYAVLQQQAQQIDEQTGKTKTLGAAQQELIKWEQELSDLKNKGTLTAAQKSLLATADQITAQKTLNAELEKDTAARMASAKQAAQMAEFQQSVADNVARYQQGLDNQVAGIGLGSEGRRRLQEDLSLQQDYAKKLEILRRDKVGGKIDQDTYDKQTQIYKDALEQQLQATRDNYAKMDAARADWTNGANAALQDYAFDAADIAGQTYDLVSDGLSGIEDAFVDLATTGKFSFKDLADSIIADLARIVAKTLIVQPLIAALFGGSAGGGAASLGGLVGSIFSGSSSGSGSSSSDSGGWGSMASLGKNIYSAWSAVTGVGADIAAGYASGGLGGAVSGGIGYYSSMLSSLGTTLSGGFTSLTTALGLQTAATTAATGTGYALGGTLVSGAAGSATYAAGTSGISAAMSSAAAMWPLAVIMGMYQSGKLYDSGVRPDGDEIRDSAGDTVLGKVVMAPGAAMSDFFKAQDKVLSKIVGGKWAAILSGSTLSQAVTKMVGEKLFGTAYTTKDVGYQLGVEGGEFEAQQYVKQKKKGGLISGSSKTKFLYSDLDPDTKDVLGGKYNDVVLGAGSLFTALGVQLNDSVLDGLNMAARNISTKDATPEWIQEQLDFFFAQLGDAAVVSISKATDAGLSGYSYVGLQAFVKNLQDVNGVLGHLNVGLYDMSVTGGFMAEQLSLWAGGIEALSTAGAAYYDAFFTDVEKSNDTLSDVRNAFGALSIALPDSRAGFRDMVSGIDKTTESGRQMLLTLLNMSTAADAAYDILEARQATYYSTFYSESENTARSLATVTKEFKDVGVTLPATRAGYRDLVEAASKDSSAAGKKMYDTLMSMAGEAGSAYDLLDSKATAATDAAKVLADSLADLLAGNVTAAMSALQRAVTAEQKSLTTAYTSSTEALNTALTAASKNAQDLEGISSTLSAALKNLRGDSESAVAMLRAQAQATLQSALATARSGGSLVGFAGLDDAISTASEMDPEVYATLEEFTREQGRTANVISELNNLNGKQLTSAEQAVVSLNDQLKQSKLTYDALMKGLDDQLINAQAQIDQLNGIDTSVISVAAAVNNLNAAIMAALANAAAVKSSAPAAVGTGTAGAPSASDLNAIYNSVLGRDVDPAGAAYWAGLVGSGAVSIGDLPQAIKNDGITNGEIRGYAKGTNNWDGSAVLVGEHGPEIVMANNLGSNTIYPAQKSRSILNAGSQDAGETDGETSSFRDKVVKRLNEITRAVGFLDVWNSDGLPATRK
ncbi:phage tail tape measure protein [Pseudomonas syringae]|uniref:phage tail tape measure protein n=1 Tax=Pseudomonas syringae TaxID=317 RepID=UPI00068B9ECB|nr:phage tail tape measure protein [Pseudomonas syringae]